jgi:hypothetical protein
MVRCDEFYEKFERDGNFCGLDPETVERIRKYRKEMRILKGESTDCRLESPIGDIQISEGALRPLVSLKDSDVAKDDSRKQIVKLAKSKIDRGEKPVITGPEIERIIELFVPPKIPKEQPEAASWVIVEEDLESTAQDGEGEFCEDCVDYSYRCDLCDCDWTMNRVVFFPQVCPGCGKSTRITRVDEMGRPVTKIVPTAQSEPQPEPESVPQKTEETETAPEEQPQGMYYAIVHTVEGGHMFTCDLCECCWAVYPVRDDIWLDGKSHRFVSETRCPSCKEYASIWDRDHEHEYQERVYNPPANYENINEALADAQYELEHIKDMLEDPDLKNPNPDLLETVKDLIDRTESVLLDCPLSDEQRQEEIDDENKLLVPRSTIKEVV